MDRLLDGLPPDLQREMARLRVLDAKQAAEFWGVSLVTWRRLYRAGKVPTPKRLGERKLGWRLGDLITAQDAIGAEAA